MLKGDSMKKILCNSDNIKESQVTNVVTRVKVILLNSKNEVLLGYSNNQFQFIGGHVEEGESLSHAINREVKEETGIELQVKETIMPDALATGYWKDWPKDGENRKTLIYYYVIQTEKDVDLSKVKYTENEKKGNFTIKYIPITSIKDELLSNAELHENARGIASEMIQILEKVKLI